MNKISRALVCSWVALFSMSAAAQGSPFAKVDFGQGITLEVPKNWSYQDETLRQQLNTSSDATVRLAGITPNPGKNVVLIAGSGYAKKNTPAATLRLSVRHGEAPSQSDFKQMAGLSPAEVREIFQPSAKETERLLMANESVRSAKVTTLSMVTNNSLVCSFQETEVAHADGETMLLQSYVCPMGSKSLKLSTSYRKTDAVMFKPIVQYVWQSLRVKG